MNECPPFFDRVRQGAAARWDRLDADPGLAGPWHQLFNQVQSPRHVLSELLQNADDAGAQEVAVRIESGVFIFEHDGEDFTEEHFASLCRFGYSNKRHLHTIGFRGVGFKSAFSLGDSVEVRTPTLSVCFDRRRFTEPRWLQGGRRSDGKTCIRVVLKDKHRRSEVGRNLEEWRRSPLSLLFLKHVRRMRLDDTELRWKAVGEGPVPNSEWMMLGERSGERVLVIRSKADVLPEEALAEIRQERMLGDESEFPPCAVEVVVGADRRLFVVLPTEVKTALPFACNAPFIQDPARLKIKDPQTSPTNRWLLQRLGALAASSMLAWLNRPDMTNEERAIAYALFPDVDRDDSTVAGVSGRIVEESFEHLVSSAPFLLTDDGGVVTAGRCVALPRTVLAVWSPPQGVELFDEARRSALSRHVADRDREKLLKWRVVEKIGKPQVLETLRTRWPPRPQAWDQLLELWNYVATEVTPWATVPPGQLRIVPVEGNNALYPADEVARLKKGKLFDSDSDWEFLARHLLVLDSGFDRFLDEQRHAAEERRDEALQKRVVAADHVLRQLGLKSPTSADKVIDRVAKQFFASQRVTIDDCVRLAQLAARLRVEVSGTFRFVTRSRQLRSIEDHVLFDEDGYLEDLIPEAKRDLLLLHSDYLRDFTSCTRDEWVEWVRSGRSGLLSFAPLVRKERRLHSRQLFEDELHRRGFVGQPSYPYKNWAFLIREWDFEDELWEHWLNLARSDARVWVRIAERLVTNFDSYGDDRKRAAGLQLSRAESVYSIASKLWPSWVLRLRDVACLPDTRGTPQKPGDLLRRTPATEALMDVEPFVHSRLDCEAARPLLDLLGVRAAPTGPHQLLDRLRALAKSETPPVYEVERWYRRLDQLADTCSTADLQAIKDSFRAEKLILTDKGTWVTVASVFLAADEEEVPSAAVVRESVADLALWRKLGVAERPTADLAIRWLNELPRGENLTTADFTRVRALLPRHAARVWYDCRAWLNLAGQLVGTEHLSYALTMQSLVQWSHLDGWVKQQTADLQSLPPDVTQAPPFSDLPLLATRLEYRPKDQPRLQGQPETRTWLGALGQELCRIELDSVPETRRVRDLARRLADTRWQRTHALEVIPYLDGTPAGMPQRADLLWLGHRLYVDDLPKAKLAKRVPEEIAKAFGRLEIKAALDYGFERSDHDVRAYVQENFKLAPADRAAGANLPPIVSGTANEEETQAAEPSVPGTIAPEFGEAGAARDGSLPDASNEAGDGTYADDDSERSTDDRRWSGRKPRGPSIMERYALAHGFRKDGEGSYLHSDGSRIAKSSGEAFPWQYRNASGDIVRYYWCREHCIEREPLTIDVEIWWLIEKQPNAYSLVLTDPQGDPVEFSGIWLHDLNKQGKLRLYPASYRLVYQDEPEM